MKRVLVLLALVAFLLIAILSLFVGVEQTVPAPVVVKPPAAAPAVGTTATPRAPGPRQRAAGTPSDAATPGRIEGTVVERPSSTPLAGAEVLLSRRKTPIPRGGFDAEPPGEPEIRVKADDDGRFAVGVPDAGPWCV